MKTAVRSHPIHRSTPGRIAIAAAVIGLSFAVASPALADDSNDRQTRFPETITLPNDAVAGDLGFRPEGIVVKGNTAYAGSLVDGTIVTANLRTGQTAPLVAADGDPAVGLKIAGPLLLVAGGPSGELRAYDRRSGAEVAVRHIPEAGFVNDLTVAGGTAYFTDSQRAVIYALPVDGDTVGEPREIPLGGDFALAPPGSFNGNGIAAFDEDTLILGQSADPDGSGSALYLVDVSNGEATRITITGGDVTAADGLLLQGRTLYVVQNRENSIAQFRLSSDGTEARFVRTLTDPDFDVPTTIDFGPRGDLYAVNARFGTPGTDSVAYEIVRVQR